MKVAVTSQGRDLDSQVDPRFGRAPYFIIVDTETGEHQVEDNKMNRDALQGAGIQAAENVCRHNVAALLTGHCGPKAFRALNAGNVKIYVNAGGTVREAVEKFKKGEFGAAAAADVEGHWE